MRIPALFCLILLAAPAMAAETPWQEVAPNVRLRLISSDVLAADGTTLVGLEVDMPISMKTYWRVPGETGIPTEIDTADSSGISGHAIQWPYPTVDQSTGYLDYVYHGALVLPVQLAVEGDAPLLHASILMGVCSDICVPVTAEFSLPLGFVKPDPGQGLRIRQALANAPLPWTDGTEPLGPAEVGGDGASLQIRLLDGTIDPASVIAATEHGEALFGVPQKSPEPDLIVLPLLGKVAKKGLEGQSITLTFITPQGPYELTRQIAPFKASGN